MQEFVNNMVHVRNTMIIDNGNGRDIGLDESYDPWYFN